MASITPMLRRLGYRRARVFVLAGGVTLLAVIATAMYARGVDSREVWAILLFIPVFVAAFLYRMIGGVAAGVVASAAYIGLRWSAIDLAGFGQLSGLIVSRTFGYLAFGLIGGWAAAQLEGPLRKLELHDAIDDATGLYNARFFLQNTDLELARSQRYRSSFSVAVLEIEFRASSERHEAAILSEVGSLIQQRIRAVDRGVYGNDGQRHIFGIVLPETNSEGAEIFVGRLATAVAVTLKNRAVSLDRVPARVVSIPGDEDELQRLRSQFRGIVGMDYPDADPSPHDTGE